MATKETARQKIAELVERFGEQYTSYKKPDYNETLTRRDFIDPFFKALGWDVDNEQGYAEAYREVIHEDKVKIGHATKAPDYSFRLPGGKRLFFVEAKKPSVAVKDDIHPAYQVRRYGWSAKLPVSIITDFEEFSVYDCLKKPNPTDKASVARIKYLSFTEYLSQFDFLWDTFSKERVLKGSFDTFVQGTANKKGTATVDREFLQSLDKWRTYLATSISLHNRMLDEDELNYAVQQTIDRIIFLRIAEDRSVEPYGSLRDAVKHGDLYPNLLQVFREADQKYNSGLFDFSKDRITEGLKVDNKVIKTIVNELYYPECPYEFSVLSVEILGSAYEQFLGKTISIAEGHRARIEEKPEVRKAGGVYYTPQYVVEYIVQQTVGKLTEGKTPEAVSSLRIVDPACGSGSFLIGAYQYLLEWHKKYYAANPPKSKKNSPLTPDGQLSTAEKKRILLNNIYGVDIDVNAVEVTKLSLLLKCMEGETQASISHQLSMFNDRVLPTLDNNIRSGNSLIDTDFYDTQLDFGEEKKVKPFNWQKAFPEVFTQGGFDAVIGNPPYVMLQNMETKEVFNYALKNYNSAKYKIDTYQLFIEKSIALCKENGVVGVITPNTFLKNIHSEPLRKDILFKTTLDSILLFNYSVFTSASVDTCILLLIKRPSTQDCTFTVYIAELPSLIKISHKMNQVDLLYNIRYDFNIHSTSTDNELLKKICQKNSTLGDYCGAYFGIQTFDRKKYVTNSKLNEDYETVIDGANIGHYSLKASNEFFKFDPIAIKSGGNKSIYMQERICVRQIGNFPIATIVDAKIFTLNTIYNVYMNHPKTFDIRFFLGILNSKLIRFFWLHKNSDSKKTFPKIKKEALLSIPIPNIGDNQNFGVIKLTKLVDQLLVLNKELQSVTLSSRRDQLQSKIDYCEERVNRLVYELYGLTEEEIGIVEKG